MGISIQEGQSLRTIENNISEVVSECEYWGDLDLTYDETEILKEIIKKTLSGKGIPIGYFCRMYPHSITTYMVFFVRYKYNINFWGVLSNELGVDLDDAHVELGDCAKKMFKRYNMDYSDAQDEVRTNIAPIIYEACLPPESSLDDLFYVLKYYDSYGNFDPQLIIDDLIEMRSYTIRKPMLRFLSRFKDDRAIEFVLEVRDAMLGADQKNDRSSRYFENYTDWKEKEKDKNVVSFRKNKEYQTKPYLFFDNGNKGLCIILPRIIMTNEWVEEVCWNVRCKGFSKNIYCNVLGDEGKRYIDSIDVSVPPSEKYVIELSDSEGLEEKEKKEWVVEDGKRDIILFFNENGRQVKTTYLLYPFEVMIIPSFVKIENVVSIDMEERYYPTNNNEYKVYSVTPLGNDASLTYRIKNEIHKMSVRPQVKMSLEGKTLFSLDANEGLFIKIPKLHVSTDGAVLTTGMELRIGKKSIPINLRCDEDNEFDLKKIASSEFGAFGTYSIRLYQMGRFIKQIEFHYVPIIKTNYSPVINWSTKNEKKHYTFSKLDDWELEFDNCTVNRDEASYIVDIPRNTGVIIASLKLLLDTYSFNCRFSLPVRPFEAKIVDGEGTVKDDVTDRPYLLGVDSFTEDELWLSLRCFANYRFEKFFIRLKSINGIDQTEQLKVNQQGAGYMNLSVFSDTIRNIPLPAELEVVCGDDSRVASILVVTEKLIMEKRPKYQIGEKKSYISLDLADDQKDIEVVRFGFNRTKVCIPYAESILSKTSEMRGYIYPGGLTEGIYVISGSKEQAVFEFEEDDSIELGVGNNTILVSCRTKDKNISTTKEWLDLLIKEAIYLPPHNDMSESRAVKMAVEELGFEQLEYLPIDDCDVEKIVALAYFVNSKISNSKKNNIRKCMRFISRKLLRRGDRFRIIELLIDLNVSQEVFDICLKEYALLLFYTDSSDVEEVAGKVDNYSTELSMLLMMSADAPIRDCVWREKYRELIGRDAIRKLLSVPNEKSPETIINEQKRFLKEINGSKVRVRLDDEITGNEIAIQGMIVLDTKYPYYPYLDVKKKPDYGLYFGRIKYVDQYVNWYKLNHNKKGEMIAEKYQMMKNAVKEYYQPIMNVLELLKCDKRLSYMTIQYMDAVHARYIQESPFSYTKYFYLQGLAAYLAKLPVKREDLDKYRSVGIEFMELAYIIAPKLSQRDILMAETFRYLKGKEDMLCR